MLSARIARHEFISTWMLSSMLRRAHELCGRMMCILWVGRLAAYFIRRA
jgi:hypothetical protein